MCWPYFLAQWARRGHLAFDRPNPTVPALMCLVKKALMEVGGQNNANAH